MPYAQRLANGACCLASTMRFLMFQPRRKDQPKPSRKALPPVPQRPSGQTVHRLRDNAAPEGFSPDSPAMVARTDVAEPPASTGIKLSVGRSVDGFEPRAVALNVSDTRLNQLNLGVVGDLGNRKDPVAQVVDLPDRLVYRAKPGNQAKVPDLRLQEGLQQP